MWSSATGWPNSSSWLWGWRSGSRVARHWFDSSGDTKTDSTYKHKRHCQKEIDTAGQYLPPSLQFFAVRGSLGPFFNIRGQTVNFKPISSLFTRMSMVKIVFDICGWYICWWFYHFKLSLISAVGIVTWHYFALMSVDCFLTCNRLWYLWFNLRRYLIESFVV